LLLTAVGIPLKHGHKTTSAVRWPLWMGLSTSGGFLLSDA
jgi:hypothetical protein